MRISPSKKNNEDVKSVNQVIFLEKGSNEVKVGKKNTLPEHLEA